MIKFIKSLFLKHKIVKEVKDIEKLDNRELQLLNVQLRGLEMMYTDYYNLVLLCPLYSLKYKRNIFEDLKSLIDIMNDYRFRNNYNFI